MNFAKSENVKIICLDYFHMNKSTFLLNKGRKERRVLLNDTHYFIFGYIALDIMAKDQRARDELRCRYIIVHVLEGNILYVHHDLC